MADRVARHRADRGPRWRTIEEPLDLPGMIARHGGPGTVVLADCLTLWLTNVMLARRDCEAAGERLVQAIASATGTVILVANEVGLGIVPDNALARRFRDAAGRLHQAIARGADEVVFIAAGLPLWLKAPAAPHPAPVFAAGFIGQLDLLLEWRRDVRHFLPTPIAEADMRSLFAAAALAPSVGNAQPWRFVRIRSPALRARLADHVDECVAAAAPDDPAQRALYGTLKLHGLREAPEVLAVFCDDDPGAGHGLGIATMREALRYSTVMAIHSLWLAARARAIGLGWVSILDPGTVTAMLDVPADWTLVAVLGLGYPASPGPVPELEARGWQAREPIADRVFER